MIKRIEKKEERNKKRKDVWSFFFSCLKFKFTVNPLETAIPLLLLLIHESMNRPYEPASTYFLVQYIF